MESKQNIPGLPAEALQNLKAVKNQRVFVTGGAGFVGKSFYSIVFFLFSVCFFSEPIDLHFALCVSLFSFSSGRHIVEVLVAAGAQVRVFDVVKPKEPVPNVQPSSSFPSSLLSLCHRSSFCPPFLLCLILPHTHTG
jgi:hypothetical protein